MCLALLRECEGSLRRPAEVTDTGDCSTIGFTNSFFFCYHRSVRRNKGGHAENIEISVVIHGRIRMWYSPLTYKLVSTVSLALKVPTVFTRII